MGDAPGEVEVFDRVFGPLIADSGMPHNSHDGLQHNTNFSVPTINVGGVSPTSDPQASFGSITSQDHGSSSQAID